MGSNVPQLKRLGALAVTLIVLAGCGQITSPATPTPTPTPSRPGPALVQVENSVLARPLSGLQHADIVYEYLAEGGITRMTVIFFNPSGTERIEPVRSAQAYVADGSPLMDTDTGHAIKPVNVIVIQVAHHDAGFTDVLGAPAQAFDLQGTGKADVFSGGHHFAATWDLSTPDQPVRYLGADGKPIRLPQGLTWVYVVDPGTTIAFS